MSKLFCFGLGYSAEALSRRLAPKGWQIAGTSRTADKTDHIAGLGYDAYLFDGTARVEAVANALSDTTHVLVSAGPGDQGDPALLCFADDLAKASNLRWIGYLSTIGVYGDMGGAWVDEETAPHATSQRAIRRAQAERQWLDFGERAGKNVQIFRLGGIYGPGRSAIDDLREGTCRRIIKPGQVFNRIHVEDIANVLFAATAGRGQHATYNVTDDQPAPPQDVIEYAAELLGVPPPPELPFETADLSPMARSFYSANRRVSNARMKTDLGVTLSFPTYREGLRSILQQVSG
jgi:nucleoside-diphosphate-sugar epimerase